MRPVVVHVIDNLGLGGAQRQLVELLKGMPRERYAQQVIGMSTEKNDYAETIRALGIPLTLIPQSGLWSWRTLGDVTRTLRAAQPSIVQTWLFTSDLYGRLAAKIAGVPVLISSVRSVEPDKPRRRVWADRLLNGWTQRFIVNAEAVGKVLSEREWVEPAKIRTIYNGIDLAAFDPARTNGAVRRGIGAGADVPVIGIVGRFAPVKDHATFLRACALAARQLPAARVALIGDGPLRAELEALSTELGLAGRVHFLGNSADAAEAFAALDLVVVSSLYEGCCNVILEAMAMNKPVVATAVGGNGELVRPGVTGLLVPARSPEHAAEAIVQILRDPAKARAMGAAGRPIVEAQFSLPRMVEATAAVYDEALAGGGR